MHNWGAESDVNRHVGLRFDCSFSLQVVQYLDNVHVNKFCFKKFRVMLSMTLLISLA